MATQQADVISIKDLSAAIDRVAFRRYAVKARPSTLWIIWKTSVRTLSQSQSIGEDEAFIYPGL